MTLELRWKNYPGEEFWVCDITIDGRPRGSTGVNGLEGDPEQELAAVADRLCEGWLTRRCGAAGRSALITERTHWRRELTSQWPLGAVPERALLIGLGTWHRRAAEGPQRRRPRTSVPARCRRDCSDSGSSKRLRSRRRVRDYPGRCRGAALAPRRADRYDGRRHLEPERFLLAGLEVQDPRRVLAACRRVDARQCLLGRGW